ncbi:hypothetical protein ACRAWD_07480 [Caulobacter segnis]
MLTKGSGRGVGRRKSPLFTLSAVFPPDMSRARHSSPVTLDRRGALAARPAGRGRAVAGSGPICSAPIRPSRSA